MTTFKDHFSARSGDYAAYRPTYPQALVDALADLCPRRDAALDVGCGSGQLSTLLSRRFASVIATDASTAQVAAAKPAERVEYRVAPAEASGLPDRSVDLITAAQAAHWFDLPRFYAEVRRIARPGAVLALIAYGVLEIDEAIRRPMLAFYRGPAGPYWPPERRHVEEGYRSLDFPFEELTLPPLAIEAEWSLGDFLGYVETWSAAQALEKAEGRQAMDAFQRTIAAAWGDPKVRRPVRFPLAVRAGRVRAIT